ncbi:MAG: hypothetical protein ABL951_05580 [Alphaproteobacteria bacterium]
MTTIADFSTASPYSIFAAVTTRGEYTISFHETMEAAQAAAVEAVGGDESAFYVERGDIRMRSSACPDYSCDAGRVSEMIKSEIEAMTSSDMAGMASVIKSWADALTVLTGPLS